MFTNGIITHKPAFKQPEYQVVQNTGGLGIKFQQIVCGAQADDGHWLMVNTFMEHRDISYYYDYFDA